MRVARRATPPSFLFSQAQGKTSPKVSQEYAMVTDAAEAHPALIVTRSVRKTIHAFFIIYSILIAWNKNIQKK
jgi:hypothetical protein